MKRAIQVKQDKTKEPVPKGQPQAGVVSDGFLTLGQKGSKIKDHPLKDLFTELWAIQSSMIILASFISNEKKKDQRNPALTLLDERLDFFKEALVPQVLKFTEKESKVILQHKDTIKEKYESFRPSLFDERDAERVKQGNSIVLYPGDKDIRKKGNKPQNLYEMHRTALRPEIVDHDLIPEWYPK